ncbi:MAG: hypothetical protein ACFFDN_20660 [Candidatus Hodarchaeota archaeon]
MLLYNDKIRSVIDTITSKAALILGNFSTNKNILEIIRFELKNRNYVPIIFDFDKPNDRDCTETIITLASISKFIIADFTDPKSVSLETEAIVPKISVPFIPIINESERPFSMFNGYPEKYNWVLDVITYKNEDQLIKHFENGIINRAETKYRELRRKKLTKFKPLKSISSF